MQTNRRLALLLFLFTLLAALGAWSAPRAAAWGYDGHCACGMIASQHLTPAAEAMVKALLASEPESGYPNLGLASRWADDIKGNPDYKWASPWHYINLPPGSTHYDAKLHDDPAKGNVMMGIARFSKELGDTAQTTATRLLALKFLAHFVQDAHQPMHAGNAEDRGGNSIKITYQGKSGNLHGYWDYMLPGAMRPEWPAYAELLNGKITQEQKAAWAATMDPAIWINTSYHLAMDFAYNIPADGVLDGEYSERALRVIDERIAEGGYHLALLINQALDKDFVLPAQKDAVTSEGVTLTMTAAQVAAWPLADDATTTATAL